MSDLIDNAALGRFEMLENGETIFADYRRNGARLIIDHVETPPRLRGTGAAGRLMRSIAARARSDNLQILPLCGFAASWLRRSTDYRDLVA